jgi:hypothetical protein
MSSRGGLALSDLGRRPSRPARGQSRNVRQCQRSQPLGDTGMQIRVMGSAVTGGHDNTSISDDTGAVPRLRAIVAAGAFAGIAVSDAGEAKDRKRYIAHCLALSLLADLPGR